MRRMTATQLAFAVCVLLAPSLLASPKTPLERLVPQCDWIVIGRLGPLRTISKGERWVLNGEIAVERVIKGPRGVERPRTLTLFTLHPDSGVMGETYYAEGDYGIWLLRPSGTSGVWSANDENALLPVERFGDVDRLLPMIGKSAPENGADEEMEQPKPGKKKRRNKGGKTKNPSANLRKQLNAENSLDRLMAIKQVADANLRDAKILQRLESLAKDDADAEVRTLARSVFERLNVKPETVTTPIVGIWAGRAKIAGEQYEVVTFLEAGGHFESTVRGPDGTEEETPGYYTVDGDVVSFFADDGYREESRLTMSDDNTMEYKVLHSSDPDVVGVKITFERYGAPGAVAALEAHFDQLYKLLDAEQWEQGAAMIQQLFPDEKRVSVAITDPGLAASVAEARSVARQDLDDDQKREICEGLMETMRGRDISISTATTEELLEYDADMKVDTDFPYGAHEVAPWLSEQQRFYQVAFRDAESKERVVYNMLFWDGEQWSLLGSVWQSTTDEIAAELKDRRDAIKLMDQCEWYPLSLGNLWRFEADRGELSMRATCYERVGETWCIRLETRFGDKHRMSQCVSVKSDGVYLHRVNDNTVEPPLMILPLPPEDQQTWESGESRVPVEKLGGPIRLHYKYEIHQDTCEVNGKEKDAMRVDCDRSYWLGEGMNESLWYVEGLGPARSRIVAGDQRVDGKLVSLIIP